MRYFSISLLFSIILLGCIENLQENSVSIKTETPTLRTSESERSTIPDPDKKLVDIIHSNNIRKSDLTILIDKSAYSLTVQHADTTLIVYPCVFGFNAVDDKAQEGDGCTPEGTFGIRSMYAHKSWSHFIWIDYPNAESWRRFKERKANGVIPSTAKIGGEIGIHGVPDGTDSMIDSKTNWTLGCISLKNTHITDLYKSINKDVEVIIR